MSSILRACPKRVRKRHTKPKGFRRISFVAERLEEKALLTATVACDNCEILSGKLEGDWYVAETRAEMLASYRSSMATHRVQAANAAASNSIAKALLTVRVFDVDFAGAPGVDPERDEIYFNGSRLTSPGTYLTGANQQWSIVSFDVDPSLVQSGSNDVSIIIDVLGGGWCLEADWGQLEIIYTDGTSRTFRTSDGPDLDLYQPCDGGDNMIGFSIDAYEIRVKEIFSYDDIDIAGIDDKVYDATLVGPGNVQPIADNFRNSFASFSWGGSFTLETHFDASMAAFPNQTFQVEYSWEILGTAKHGTGQFTISASDPDEELTIEMPTSVGRYEIDLDFEVQDANGNIVGMLDVPNLRLYATYSEPTVGWFTDPDLAWLDKATEWASGATTDFGVVEGIWSGIYSKSGWLYRDVGNPGSTGDWTKLIGVGGSSPAGNCFTFAYAWDGLCRTLGVSTTIASTVVGTPKFLTGEPGFSGRALDGLTGNARPLGGATDRWLFSTHKVGFYGTSFYDPTFGNKWASEIDSFVAGYSGPRRSDLITGRSQFDVAGFTVTETLFSPIVPHRWGDWIYLPTSSPSPQSSVFSLSAAAIGNVTLASSYGIDSNGDGVFDQLAMDITLDVPAAGTYFLTGYTSSDGEFITDRASYYNMIGTLVQVDAAAPGQTSATILFSGEDIFRSGLDGPFTGVLTIFDPNGEVTTVSFDTAAFLHTQFGELAASLGTVSAVGRDTNLNGKFEDLVVSVDIDGRSGANLYIEANIYSPSGSFLGATNGQFSIVAGMQTVDLAFDGGLFHNSGIDGPYKIEVLMFDDQFQQIGFQTTQSPAYSHLQFESRGAISGNYNEIGVDTNGNTFFDQLVVELDATVMKAGTYDVEASLYDSQGNVIQTVINTVSLQVGVNELTFKFGGRTIYEHGAAGPYFIKYVALRDQNVLDVVADAFATRPYLATDFEPPSTSPVDFSGVFSDRAVDDNGDGILDRLIISVEFFVAQSGNYDLNGRILDVNGQEINFGQTNQFLTGGQTHVLELSFDGDAIYQNGGDGPFDLRDLSAYLVSNQSVGDFLSTAYQTAFYDADWFGVPVNQLPSVTVDGPQKVLRGQKQTYQFVASDLDLGDETAGFVFMIDWGDGTSETVERTPENGVQPLVHAYAASGSYSIIVFVVDQKNANSAPATLVVDVIGAGLLTDPADPNKLALFVGGTNGPDKIRVKKTESGQLQVFIQGESQGEFSPSSRIYVYGYAGRDDIRVSKFVEVSALLDGGKGSDALRGGGGKNVLVGGAGKDQLDGGRKRDLLIGGLGKDRLAGKGEEDIFIGGTTAFDQQAASLFAIMKKWASKGDYFDRIHDLEVGSASIGSRQSLILKSNGAGATVFGDSEVDSMDGREGRDWFFANPSGMLMHVPLDQLDWFFSSLSRKGDRISNIRLDEAFRYIG